MLGSQSTFLWSQALNSHTLLLPSEKVPFVARRKEKYLLRHFTSGNNFPRFEILAALYLYIMSPSRYSRDFRLCNYMEKKIYIYIKADIRFELIKAGNMSCKIPQCCHLSAFQHISLFNCMSNNGEASWLLYSKYLL